MQNVGQNDSPDAAKDVKSVEVGQASMTSSSNLSVMSMENGQVLTGISEQQNFIELSASEEEEVSEVTIVVTFHAASNTILWQNIEGHSVHHAMPIHYHRCQTNWLWDSRVIFSWSLSFAAYYTDILVYIWGAYPIGELHLKKILPHEISEIPDLHKM